MLKKVLLGLKWTGISSIVVTVLQLLKLSILGRILSPEDFGLASISMIVIGFTGAFADLGISNALIQSNDLDRRKLSDLYWLNILSGSCLFLIVSLSSSPIASFFGNDKIQDLIVFVASIFLFKSFGQQFAILFQKRMEFRTISVVNQISEFFGFLVTITLAVLDFNVWSLVTGVVFSAILNSSLFFYLGIRAFSPPKFKFYNSEIGPIIKFGMYQMGERSVNYISANIDKFLIGRILGAEALGFYNLAYQLITIPLTKINPIINQVALPTYSKLKSSLNERNSYYLLTIEILIYLSIPIAVFLSLFSSELISIYMGDGWEIVAELVSILSFVGLIKALTNPGGALFLSAGRADIGFWWNIFWMILILTGISVGLYLFPSLFTVSWILLGLSLATAPIWHGLIKKVLCIEYRSISIALILVLSVSFGIGTLTSVLVRFLDSLFLQSILSIMIYGGLYLGFLFVSRKRLNAKFKTLKSE